MLLGHWLEMRAIGQAQGALAALAELLPDKAERVVGDGLEVVHIDELRRRRRRAGATRWARPCGRRRSSTAPPRSTKSMITGESRPVAEVDWRSRRRRDRRDRLGDPRPRRRDRGRHGVRRYPTAGRRSTGIAIAGTGARRPVRRDAVLRRRRRRQRSRSWSGRSSDDTDASGRTDRDRARDRLPARTRAGHPAHHRRVDRSIRLAPGSS